MSQAKPPLHLATRAVRAALESDTQYGAVVPPIHLSSTYTFAGFGQRRQYDYSRSANPTRDALGAALADLEQGAGGVVTSSGMAAVNLLCQLVKPDEWLVAPHDCYGGTYRLFDALNKRGALRVRFVDFRNAAAVTEALALRPRLVWVETPSNPLLRLTDIAAVAQQAHAVDAWLAVDNTFLSPVWQQPLALGADFVVHSTTKYLNGHSDVVGGAVVAATTALHEQLVWWANCVGITGAPFDSYLTLRGMRSLHARMAVHGANAQRIAEMLAVHPAIQAVHYPGLTSHPQHELAKRQQQGFGAMVSFELKGGLREVEACIGQLHLFSLAESLGGVESLVAHPATMTHSAISAEARATAGIGDNLLRLSVGIENGDDLLAELTAALDAL